MHNIQAAPDLYIDPVQLLTDMHMYHKWLDYMYMYRSINVYKRQAHVTRCTEALHVL